MTKSLKVAVCASLMLGAVSTGFAYQDPIDEAVQQFIKPTQDVFAELAQKAIEPEQVQGATAAATEAMAQKAGEIADTAKSGLKDASNAIYQKGTQAVDYLKESGVYQTVSEKADQAYKAASDKVTQLKATEAYKAVADKASQAYDAVSDKVGQIKTTEVYKKAAAKATEALKWVKGQTPDQIKVWVADHPYLTVTAVVTPIALYIWYKISKSKPADDRNSPSHSEER